MSEPEHFLRQLRMYDVDVPEGHDLAMAMPVHEQVSNTRGALQGGLIATLVDICAGRAAAERAGPGHGVPTADLHIRYLAPLTTGPAVALARVLRVGRRSIVVQCDVHDEGRATLAATATLSFTIVERRPGQEETVARGRSAFARRPG